jgi:hypothetical protein
VSPLVNSIEQRTPIGIHHVIAGNMFRVKGEFVFAPDQHKPLPVFYRTLFRLYAWPLQLRYGYLGAKRRATTDHVAAGA